VDTAAAAVGDLGVDLGKTSCRVRLVTPDGAVEAAWSGAEGFAAADGAAQALAAFDGALSALPEGAPHAIRRIGVGAAGVDAGREAARAFAAELARRHRAEVAIVSDALAAHAGALGGATGTVLVAGTGAVAFHLDDAGAVTRADGWGIWLGDLGSGRWIGQEGLRRVLQARDGLGPRTTLTDAAAALAGAVDALPRYVSGTARPERVLGGFAPVVLEHAAAGDAVAAAIVAEAVARLAATTAACTAPGERLSLVGGLTGSAWFSARLAAALAARGLAPTAPLGDPVAGALLLCAASDLPHERSAIRVRH
jgi:N-acetylglucosamine kinase-like BadF-type ATPase